eukprot:409193-Lingulodinium_polyedra.AAC.1
MHWSRWRNRAPACARAATSGDRQMLAAPLSQCRHAGCSMMAGGRRPHKPRRGANLPRATRWP